MSRRACQFFMTMTLLMSIFMVIFVCSLIFVVILTVVVFHSHSRDHGYTCLFVATVGNESRSVQTILCGACNEGVASLTTMWCDRPSMQDDHDDARQMQEQTPETRRWDPTSCTLEVLVTVDQKS